MVRLRGCGEPIDPKFVLKKELFLPITTATVAALQSLLSQSGFGADGMVVLENTADRGKKAGEVQLPD